MPWSCNAANLEVVFCRPSITIRIKSDLLHGLLGGKVEKGGQEGKEKETVHLCSEWGSAFQKVWLCPIGIVAPIVVFPVSPSKT